MTTVCYNMTGDALDQKAIAYAAKVIRDGGLVAIPTETVYGLGANALNEEAVKHIYEAKGRPSDNPLILHIPNASWLERYCERVPESAYRLAEEFWPGPLTMILPRKDVVPDRTTGGLDTVGIRCPNHPVTLALIEAADLPIAAPSANTSGRPSCTAAEHVLEDMNGKIECILDGGPCSVGVESTIIDLTCDPPRLLRPGGLPLEELERVLGTVEIDAVVTRQMGEGEKPRAPGMKYRHYAPHAPVTAVTGTPAASAQYILEHMDKRDGVICYDEFASLFPEAEVQCIGSLQNKGEQARRVFDALRSFDHTQVTRIMAQCPDSTGLGLAIGNRLKKAAGFHVVDVTGVNRPAERFRVIGITGGSGTGKTTALQVLGKLGMAVIDCDQVYHELLLSTEKLRQELSDTFGNVFEGVNLNRKKLGELVYHDAAAMEKLNFITHKYVISEVKNQVEDAKRAGMIGAAIDAILLLESGLGDLCDVTVGITAPLEERVRRLMARDKITESYASSRIDAQQSEQYYKAKCNFLLENNSTEEAFAEQSETLFRKIMEVKDHE